MDNQQVLRKENREIKVTMTGEGFEDTVGNLFQMMRKEVFKQVGKPIIQMDTDDVVFDSVVVKEKTERFLFLFMPRVKQYYTIAATIQVSVKFIDYKEKGM